MQSDHSGVGNDDDGDDNVNLHPGQIANLPPLRQLVGRNWITLKQLGRLVGVTYQSILRWKKQGKFKTVKVGGSFRIYEEELRRFLQEGNLDDLEE